MKREPFFARLSHALAVRPLAVLLAMLIALAMPLAVSDDSHALDSTFETSLLRFPSSYRAKLRALHQLHPNWIFEPVAIDDDWATVISRESSPEDTNLVPKTSPVGWIKKYTIYDGTSWVAATKDIIEYFMDPRNFLDERSVFQFEKLTFDAATQTESGVRRIFGSNQGLLALAPTVMTAARTANVSAYLLASRMKQEISESSSYGIINSARGHLCLNHLPTTAGGISPCFISSSGLTHSGARYYNLFNIGATPNPGVLNGARINGIRYAAGLTNTDPAYQARFALPWTSQAKAAVGGATFIASKYIAVGQDTMYFQKFAVVGSAGRYTHQYMQNLQAAASEGRRYFDGYSASGSLGNAFTFRIPVYRGLYATSEAAPVVTPSRTNPAALAAYAGQAFQIRSGIYYNIRTRPSTAGDSIGTARGGQVFRVNKPVTGEKTTYGNLWYQITFNGRTAYVVTDLNGQTVLN